MYLTSREFALVSEVFRLLADRTLPEDVLRLEVGRRLLDLLRADFLGSYVWDDALGRFGRRVAINMSDDNLRDYEEYFQFRDPIAPLLMPLRTAARVTDVMSREELVRTEIFNDFLRRDGLHWGMNLFVWSGDHNIGDLRIWRAGHREDFSDRELALFELVRPAFTAALVRSRAAAGAGGKAGGEAGGEAGGGAASLAPSPEAVNDAFGRLTPREREVVALVAEGLLDKEIAQRLGISYTTVRTHLDRCFQKLGVSNRSRLVRLLRR